MKPLAVIACHFNPCRYSRPVSNWYRFLNGMKIHSVDVVSIAASFSDAPSLVLADEMIYGLDPNKSSVWQKEALLNKLISQVAKDYWAVAWVDGDLLFTSTTLVDDTLRELDHSPVCQMFSQALWLDKDGEVERTCRSVGWHLSTGANCWDDFTVSHPGFAWAARSSFLLRHGLYPFMITGCGDTAMLRGFTGGSLRGFDADVGPHCMASLDKWSSRVWEDVKLNVGFVLGSAVHMWHGDIRNRFNRDRRTMMSQVNPDEDLRVCDNGVLEWTEHALRNKSSLVKRVQGYFLARNEDGVQEPR